MQLGTDLTGIESTRYPFHNVIEHVNERLTLYATMRQYKCVRAQVGSAGTSALTTPPPMTLHKYSTRESISFTVSLPKESSFWIIPTTIKGPE